MTWAALRFIIRSWVTMFQAVRLALFSVGLLALAGNATAQSNYQVVSLSKAATITGTVKWSGPLPRTPSFPINNDPELCESHIGNATAQSNYQVVSLSKAATITGTVKWSGPLPRIPSFPINKDPEICESRVPQDSRP